jgi:folate-binding protein YgfZ
MQTSFGIRLNHRSVIRIGGADRRAFLQGILSNDIELCVPGRPLYAALLTPQGKFLHDLFLFDADEEFLIDCDGARVHDLLTRVAGYKLRAKVNFSDASQEYGVWVQSPGPSIAPPLYPDPRLAGLGARGIVKKANYDRQRLALGVADGARDMLVGKSALLEGNFDFLNGVSWTKGCYVGQELTARMHHRALAKKRLLPARIEGAAPVFGAVVTLDGEDIGDMRSSAGDLGLALLNLEKADRAMRENKVLICGESRLQPYLPDWMKNQP